MTFTPTLNPGNCSPGVQLRAPSQEEGATPGTGAGQGLQPLVVDALVPPAPQAEALGRQHLGDSRPCSPRSHSWLREGSRADTPLPWSSPHLVADVGSWGYHGVHCPDPEFLHLSLWAPQVLGHGGQGPCLCVEEV